MRNPQLLVDLDINILSMNFCLLLQWKWIPVFINEPFGGKNFYEAYWLCFYWGWRIGDSDE